MQKYALNTSKNEKLSVAICANGYKSTFQLQDNRPQTIQRKSNNTGLPDNLKSGIENLSGHINNSREYVSHGQEVIQRIVNLTATQYQARIAPGGALTRAQLGEYVKFVLKDDLTLARAYADSNIAAVGPGGVAFPAGATAADGEEGAIPAYLTAINLVPAAGAGIAANILAADGLATLLNTITSRVLVNHPTYNVQIGPVAPGGMVGQVAANIPVPNTQTRYSDAPVPAATPYAHSNMRPLWAATYAATPGNHVAKSAAADLAAPEITWASEAAGQTQFGQTAGAVLLAAPQVASRLPNEPVSGTVRPQIKQLTWAQASEFLPRPLLNLLFDIKSQLVAGARIIDERTPHDQHPGVRNATSTDHGTLRSWHEDSSGILPANGLAGIGAAAIPAPVPAVALPLHTHYDATSRAGAGAAAGAALAPRGFAEYTGAGTANIHNIKIVQDYITDRIYLTLTHYQYWAIVNTAAGGSEFVAGGSQNIATALATIQADPIVIAALAAGNNYQLMNPWLEVLVP